MTPEKPVVEPLSADVRSSFSRLIGDVHRVISLDRGDRGGEWNTALAALDYSVDIAGATLDAARTASVAGLDPERLAAALHPTWFEPLPDRAGIPVAEWVMLRYDVNRRQDQARREAADVIARINSAPSIEQEPGPLEIAQAAAADEFKAENGERYLNTRLAIEYAAQRTGSLVEKDGMVEVYTILASDWNRIVAVARGSVSAKARATLDHIHGTGRARPLTPEQDAMLNPGRAALEADRNPQETER